LQHQRLSKCEIMSRSIIFILSYCSAVIKLYK
jgi:hypothetical protein